MTLNPITIVEQVLGMYCSHISTEFQVRNTQLRRAEVCRVNPGGRRQTSSSTAPLGLHLHLPTTARPAAKSFGEDCVLSRLRGHGLTSP